VDIKKVETNYIQEIYIIHRYLHEPQQYFSLIITNDNDGMKFNFKAQKKSSGDPKHSLLFILKKSEYKQS
jgi:hypothetical protein